MDSVIDACREPLRGSRTAHHSEIASLSLCVGSGSACETTPTTGNHSHQAELQLITCHYSFTYCPDIPHKSYVVYYNLPGPNLGNFMLGCSCQFHPTQYPVTHYPVNFTPTHRVLLVRASSTQGALRSGPSSNQSMWIVETHLVVTWKGGGA